jgi:uncharacterized protein (DUF1499 family)
MIAAKPEPDRRAAATARALAWGALTAALVSAAAALLAGPAYRLHWVALATAFMVLRWATYGAIASTLVATIAWGILQARGPSRGRAVAALAGMIGIVVAAPPLYLYDRAQRLPKIHDISTDTTDPPVYVDVLPLRQGARNPVDYKLETAALQQRGYPDIEPLVLEMPPVAAFERAGRVARSMGWRIVSDRSEALRIEATDTTLLFGFEDDIVIRVRPQGSRSVVDVRSLSRIGGSDIGTNARRVRTFLRKLAAS